MEQVTPFEICESMLPSRFTNAIISNEGCTTVIRSSLRCLKDIRDWVSEFEAKSQTNWNTRTSMPFGKRIVCSKKFLCHRTGFMKKPKDENKRGVSKNEQCNASIVATIKLDTIDTRKKDPYVKLGLRGVIKINNNHSHAIKSPENLHFLRANRELRETFFEYFSQGMTVAEAKSYHLSLILQSEDNKECLLASGSSNPTYRTLQHWYTQWKRLSLKFTQMEKVQNIIEIKENKVKIKEETDTLLEAPALILCDPLFLSGESIKAEVVESLNEYGNEVDMDSDMDSICAIIKHNCKRFKTSKETLHQVKQVLLNIKSKEEWETFINQ